MAQLDAVEAENTQLQKEQADKCVTKKQLTDLITQKAKAVDMKSKELEKQYLKKVDTSQPMDAESFTKAYLEQRVAYHKY